MWSGAPKGLSPTRRRRLNKETLPEGSAKQINMGKDQFETVLDEYYHLRGWDSEERPLFAVQNRVSVFYDNIFPRKNLYTGKLKLSRNPFRESLQNVRALFCYFLTRTM